MEKIIYVKEGDLYDINSVLKSGNWTVKSVSPVALMIDRPSFSVGNFGAYVVIKTKED